MSDSRVNPPSGPPSEGEVRAAAADEQSWLLAETVATLKGRCVALRVELARVTRERDELLAARDGEG